MSTLERKIDFVAFITVDNANPNGDPLNGNRPRTDYNDYGEISDVCIKRKIRNRMQDMGYDIFVQSDDRCAAKVFKSKYLTKSPDIQPLLTCRSGKLVRILDLFKALCPLSEALCPVIAPVI